MEQLVKMVFDGNKDVRFIASLSSDLEMKTYTVYEKNNTIGLTKDKAFSFASCEDCDLISKKKVSEPIDYVYANFEENRVFLISKNNDDYYVEMYGNE